MKVDASLIGGARVQVGDDVIHASVRDTLDKMAVALALINTTPQHNDTGGAT